MSNKDENKLNSSQIGYTKEIQAAIERGDKASSLGEQPIVSGSYFTFPKDRISDIPGVIRSFLS